MHSRDLAGARGVGIGIADCVRTTLPPVTWPDFGGTREIRLVMFP